MTLNFHKYLSATLAFSVWGSWTYYINIESESNLISALYQGSFSAVSTLLMVYLIAFFYNLFPAKNIYFALPSILTVALASACIISMHIYIHTYDVINTVLPSITISFFFSLYTTYIIRKNSNLVLEK